MKLGTISLVAVLVFAVAPLLLAASPTESPEARGLAIAVEADRRDTGWGDSSSDLRMILRNRHGQQSLRQMRSRTLEVDRDGDKLLVIFDHPADVKGTAFLTFTHKEGPDDRWLYLPALRRIKRISSHNKSGPFVGSEFAYEDLTSQEVEKYTYRYLRDEVLNGIDCFVVERDPVDPKSGYTRQVVWYDKAEYRPQKIEFYDRKGALLKTLIFKGYRQYLGQYWRADRMLMQNHQTGKSTDLAWEKYDFRTGITERDFNSSRLRAAR